MKKLNWTQWIAFIGAREMSLCLRCQTRNCDKSSPRIILAGMSNNSHRLHFFFQMEQTKYGSMSNLNILMIFIKHRIRSSSWHKLKQICFCLRRKGWLTPAKSPCTVCSPTCLYDCSKQVPLDRSIERVWSICPNQANKLTLCAKESTYRSQKDKISSSILH